MVPGGAPSVRRRFRPSGHLDARGTRSEPIVFTSANRLPAVANYIRKPGDTHYRPFMLDVLRVEAGGISEVVAFELPELLLSAFALPNALSAEAR